MSLYLSYIDFLVLYLLHSALGTIIVYASIIRNQTLSYEEHVWVMLKILTAKVTTALNKRIELLQEHS